MSNEMRERQLLATFIDQPQLICRDIDDLFENIDNRDIYRAIINLVDEGEKVGFVSIYRRLDTERHAFGEKVGSLMDFVIAGNRNIEHTSPTYLGGDVRRCIEILKQEQARNFIKGELNDPTVNFQELKQSVMAIELGVQPMNGLTAPAAVDELRKEMALPETDKIYSGFDTVDKAMRGWRKGETAMFMARTTVGKTWVILSIIRRMAPNHQRVAFFSLEGAPARISERMLQVYFDVAQPCITETFINGPEMVEYDEAMKNVSFHHRTVSPQDVIDVIDREKPDVVVVDFLGLLKSGIEGSAYERASENVKALKSIAVDKKVFMLYAHQISRQGEDGSIAVQLNHARDSGQIEELTDYIVGMWRPDIHSEIPEEKYRIKAEILKNKSGDTRSFEARIMPSGRVVEVDRRMV